MNERGDVSGTTSTKLGDFQIHAMINKALELGVVSIIANANDRCLCSENKTDDSEAKHTKTLDFLIISMTTDTPPRSELPDIPSISSMIRTSGFSLAEPESSDRLVTISVLFCG